MGKSSQPRGSRDRFNADAFNATVGEIGFVVHRSKPLNWSIRDLANDRYDIMAFTIDGRARYECEGERFDVDKGTLLFFPKGVRHSARSDPEAPWSFFSMGFVIEPYDAAAAERFAHLPRHVHVGNFTHVHDTFDELDRLWTTCESGFSMACRGLVLLLLQQYVAAAEHQQPSPPHAAEIETVIEQMRANVGEVASVGELAEQVDLSESRFRVLFREMTGCSVTRYQNRLRIQAARDLLASGHYSVSAVAEELGFRDVYYFSRLFKKMTGVPPSACLP